MKKELSSVQEEKIEEIVNLILEYFADNRVGSLDVLATIPWEKPFNVKLSAKLEEL